MPSDLAPILVRVPQWRDRTDLTTTFLSGGITNQNYRVDVPASGESFVLRVAGYRTDLLGIRRANEYAANRAAAEIGVAPEVYAFIEPEGYLVTRFIRGREIPVAEMQQLESLGAIGALLAQVHQLPAIPGTFSPFQVVRDYDALARANGVTAFPENYAWLRERMDEIEVVFRASQKSSVPCHNDLLNGNFLRDADGKTWILDWEYAGMGDRFFDLANFAAHHELDDERIRKLLAAYFGQATEAEFARLKLMQAMSDFREAMWGVLQQGISQLDFDFRGYADQFFTKLTARLQDPRYATWLTVCTTA